MQLLLQQSIYTIIRFRQFHRKKRRTEFFCAHERVFRFRLLDRTRAFPKTARPVWLTQNRTS